MARHSPTLRLVAVLGLLVAGCGQDEGTRAQRVACDLLGEANPEAEADLVTMARAFARATDDMAWGEVVAAGNPIHPTLQGLDREPGPTPAQRRRLVTDLRGAADAAREACRSAEATG